MAKNGDTVTPDRLLDMTLDDVITKTQKGKGRGRKGRGKSRRQAPTTTKTPATGKVEATGRSETKATTEGMNKLDMSLEDVMAQDTKVVKKGKGKSKGSTLSARLWGGAGKRKAKGTGKSRMDPNKSLPQSWGSGGKKGGGKGKWNKGASNGVRKGTRKGGNKGAGKAKSRMAVYADKWGRDDYWGGKGWGKASQGTAYYEDWDDSQYNRGGKHRGKGKAYAAWEEDYPYGSAGGKRGGGGMEYWDDRDELDYTQRRVKGGKGTSARSMENYYDTERRVRPRSASSPPSPRRKAGVERRAFSPPPRPAKPRIDDQPSNSDRHSGVFGRSIGHGYGQSKRGRDTEDDAGLPRTSQNSGSKRIKVTHIPKDLDWRDIKEAFENETGEIIRCEMDKDGTAYIDYKTHRDAMKAVDVFDLGELNNRTIGVTLVH